MESPQRKLPEDPLAFIQTCIRQRSIFWTYHVNMRLQRRSIARQAILDAIDTYEVIEAYPEDKYFPSYLVLARYQEEWFHILCATDVQRSNVRIVTAYRPSPDEWESDGKTRRTP
ncbi:MAG: DUF4258 domain-containing protein [Candidatus Tectimicrobiota bacterium]